MKRIAVYCGSNKGVRPEYAEAAEQLGAMLAREKIELIYGSGCVGLMGIVADAALKNGGHVTYEEIFEVLAWSQLGWHQKPIGLLDTAGFYRSLLGFLDHAASEGFIRPKHRELVLVENDAEKLLPRLKTFQPATEVKWVS